MAAKKSNAGNILLVIGVVIAAYVILVVLSKKKPAAGSGGGGGLVGGGGPLGSLLPKPASGSGGGISGGGGGFGPGAATGRGSGGSSSSILQNFLRAVSSYNQQVAMILQPQYPDLSGLSIPSQSLQLFDVNQLATDIPLPSGDLSNPDYLPSTDLSGLSIPSTFDWGNYSPNDFLVTQDIQQPVDLSSYGIDPNYGADQLQVQYLDNTSSYQDPLNEWNSPSGSALDSGY